MNILATIARNRWMPWILAVGIVGFSLRLFNDVCVNSPPVLRANPAPRIIKKAELAPAPEPRGVDISLNPATAVDDLPSSRPNYDRQLVSRDTPNGMALMAPGRHTYTYVFEGKVASHGKPCPGAGVIVRLSTENETRVQGAVADDNGDYSITVSIDAQPDQAIDYVMNAHDPASNHVELVGRRITAHEEETVTVRNPINILVADLPK